MSDLGAFESVFRRALRDRFEYAAIRLERILIITDLEEAAASAFQEQVQRYLSHALSLRGIEVSIWDKRQFAPWPQLKQRIKQYAPDLIVTYRLLWVEDMTATKSLGSYVDLLSQDTQYPILIMPHPALQGMDPILTDPGAVMVATEHGYANHRMVNFALSLLPEKRPLFLVHIEDQDTFDYYMKAIGKIPDIDTEAAHETIQHQLLAGPQQYADSVAETLAEIRPGVDIQTHIMFGHLIDAYRSLMKTHETDLLVVDTKDDTQLAMHSVGYSLAVEFRQTPVLLL
ncbi:MAG: hypothetical protein AAFV07_01705 [Bacteroidota bacterium]